MMAFLLLALLAQATNSEIESLVRDLGNELIEVRERAHRRLIEIGMPAVPALIKAASSSDVEVANRAHSIRLAVDRPFREQEHDERERARLIARLHPDFVKSWKDKPLKFEGAYFQVFAHPVSKGVVIWTDVAQLFQQYEGGRVGDVWFDVEILSKTPGHNFDLERCTICRKFLAKLPDGSPFKMRVRGVQTWFSRYEVEFPDPRDGAVQFVGDMTVTLAWPEVVIRSRDGWKENSLNLREPHFVYDLRPGAKPGPPRKGKVLSGGGCGAGGPPPHGWCWCPGGPTIAASNPEPPNVYELRLSGNTDGVPLESVSRIRCVVWKPFQIPIDFTVDVDPK